MNKEYKEKWVTALRSGKYKQGQGGLRNKDEFCCLGVLCDLVAPEKWEKQNNDIGFYTIFDNDDFIPEEIANKLDMEINPQVYIISEDEVDLDDWQYKNTFELSELNDQGCPFEKIADLIEKQL